MSHHDHLQHGGGGQVCRHVGGHGQGVVDVLRRFPGAMLVLDVEPVDHGLGELAATRKTPLQLGLHLRQVVVVCVLDAHYLKVYVHEVGSCACT